MKRLVLATTCLMVATAAVAAGEKMTAQQKVWTDDYQYGAKDNESKDKKLAQDGQLDPAPQKNGGTPSKKGQWTDEYQYGKKGKDTPKIGKPSESGEFEVAPKK